MAERTTQREIAAQALITPECRENRGDEGAWEEAVRCLKVEYDAVVEGWAEAPEQPSLQLVLYCHRPVEVSMPAVPPLPTERETN